MDQMKFHKRKVQITVLLSQQAEEKESRDIPKSSVAVELNSHRHEEKRSRREKGLSQSQRKANTSAHRARYPIHILVALNLLLLLWYPEILSLILAPNLSSKSTKNWTDNGSLQVMGLDYNGQKLCFGLLLIMLNLRQGWLCSIGWQVLMLKPQKWVLGERLFWLNFVA